MADTGTYRTKTLDLTGSIGILGERKAFYERPHLVSVKRSIRSERPEAVLFERSEFTDDSERRRLSSEADAALNFLVTFSFKRKVTFKPDNI